MKRLLASLALLTCSVFGWSQSIPITGQVISTFGGPVPNALVRVCSVTSTGTPCTPTTPIFNNFALSGSPLPNPTTADQFGNFTVYGGVLSAPNMYLVQVSPDGGTNWFSYVYPGPFLPLSGGTLSGSLTDTFGFIGPLTGNVTGTVTGHSTLDCALAGCMMSGILNDSSGFIGPLTGNVTGAASLNVLKAGDTMTGSLTAPAFIGNLFGNVCGNVSGNISGSTGFFTAGVAVLNLYGAAGSGAFTGPGAGTSPSGVVCVGSACDSIHGAYQFTAGSATPTTGIVLQVGTSLTPINGITCFGEIRLSSSPWTRVDTALTYTATPGIQIIFNLTGSALTAGQQYTALYTGCMGS